MKKNDIPARTALAYKARKYSSIEPAYVLDTDRLWTYSRPYGSDARKWATSTETKFTATRGFYTDRHGDHGFLTVVIHARQFDAPGREIAMHELEQLIAVLPSPLLADDVREFESKRPSGVWLGVVNNVRLVGEWLGALEAQTATRKAEDEKRKAERVKREAHLNFVTRIEDAAASQGFDTSRIRKEANERLSVPASMLAKLLGVEPEA